MHIKHKNIEHFLWICLQVKATRSCRWLVNIGSGDDLEPSSSKSLPEPMLTKFVMLYGITRPQWIISLRPTVAFFFNKFMFCFDSDFNKVCSSSWYCICVTLWPHVSFNLSLSDSNYMIVFLHYDGKQIKESPYRNICTLRVRDSRVRQGLFWVCAQPMRYEITM